MKPYEMPFAMFAESVKPTGAWNRFPSIGVGEDVFSYAVYMNGPVSTELSEHLRMHEFKDVMLHALTEKLQLDPGSFRDNLKVAEMVATRSAWMSAVLERPVGEAALSDQILDDYAALTTGLSHPWISGELRKQREMTERLQPALDHASASVGANVKDRAPKEVSIGKVVSQSSDFTVQRTTDGEVVTHENRRLQALPIVGTEVMVGYYRGSGQVVDSLQNVKVSAPFVDPVSKDLAVMLADKGGKEQVVLFNSISGFSMFVKAHGLDTGLVNEALTAMEASPKQAPAGPVRKSVSEVYVESESGCLAVDFTENGVQYSALFADAKAVEAIGKEYGLVQKDFVVARGLDSNRASVPLVTEAESKRHLQSTLVELGYSDVKAAPENGGSYIGKVVAESGLHVAQDIGRRQIVIHDLRTIDKVAVVGESLTVKYENGRGRVTDMVRDSGGIGR